MQQFTKLEQRGPTNCGNRDGQAKANRPAFGAAAHQCGGNGKPAPTHTRKWRQGLRTPDQQRIDPGHGIWTLLATAQEVGNQQYHRRGQESKTNHIQVFIGLFDLELDPEGWREPIQA